MSRHVKKRILNIISFVLFISCSDKDSLVGHWHEYLDENQDFENCYIISDSTISINKFTNGATFQLDMSNNSSNVWEFIPYPDSILQSHSIQLDKVTFANKTKWISQSDTSKTFLEDFSAGYKIRVHPFESKIKNSDSISYHNDRLSIVLACGPIKSQYVDQKNGFLKNHFYFQINDKLTTDYEDLVEFINCLHCQLDKIDLYVNMDRNTPNTMKRKLDNIITFFNFKQNQVFYLHTDIEKLTKGYKNKIANSIYN